jgi:hypothetical protein
MMRHGGAMAVQRGSTSRSAFRVRPELKLEALSAV